ncbi:Myb-like DNA-binding domain protein [Kappamyces sp. JEL0680]|nr:Myb-like DNA-binding domain protein [Kappamyces sp. JEL0680]
MAAPSHERPSSLLPGMDANMSQHFGQPQPLFAPVSLQSAQQSLPMVVDAAAMDQVASNPSSQMSQNPALMNIDSQQSLVSGSPNSRVQPPSQSQLMQGIIDGSQSSMINVQAQLLDSQSTPASTSTMDPSIMDSQFQPQPTTVLNSSLQDQLQHMQQQQQFLASSNVLPTMQRGLSSTSSQSTAAQQAENASLQQVMNQMMSNPIPIRNTSSQQLAVLGTQAASPPQVLSQSPRNIPPTQSHQTSSPPMSLPQVSQMPSQSDMNQENSAHVSLLTSHLLSQQQQFNHSFQQSYQPQQQQIYAHQSSQPVMQQSFAQSAYTMQTPQSNHTSYLPSMAIPPFPQTQQGFAQQYSQQGSPTRTMFQPPLYSAAEVQELQKKNLQHEQTVKEMQEKLTQLQDSLTGKDAEIKELLVQLKERKEELDRVNAFVAKNVIAQAKQMEDQQKMQVDETAASTLPPKLHTDVTSFGLPTEQLKAPVSAAAMSAPVQSTLLPDGPQATPTMNSSATITVLGGMSSTLFTPSVDPSQSSSFFAGMTSGSTTIATETLFQQPAGSIDPSFYAVTLPEASSVFVNAPSLFGDTALASLLSGNPSIPLSVAKQSTEFNAESPLDGPVLHSKPSIEYPNQVKKQKSEEAEESTDPNVWTPNENSKLAEAVEEFGQVWEKVASKFTHKTAQSCEAQWQAIQPKKGKWSDDEDAKLVTAYKLVFEQEKEHYPEPPVTSSSLFWYKVAGHIPGRSGTQCMARYTETLDPNVKKGKWSQEEDAYLLEGYEMHGKSWVKVASHVPGRTQRQCRTRWVMLNNAKATATVSPVTELVVMDEVKTQAPTTPPTLTFGKEVQQKLLDVRNDAKSPGESYFDDSDAYDSNDSEAEN